MADAYKVLYQGQLPSSAGVLATVGASKAWIIKEVSVVNTDTSTRTFQLWINGTADSNAWAGSSSNPVSLKAGESYVYDGSRALDADATIQGVASTASKLTVTITGDEVS